MKNNTTPSHNLTTVIPAKSLIFIALVQGLLLLLLHQAIAFDYWPHQQPQWLFAAYSLALIAPLMLLLGLSDRPLPIVRYTAGFALLAAGLGYYVGSQAIPFSSIPYQPLLFLFTLTILIATFKALMYTQHFAEGGRLRYSRLYRLSWRNFLTLGLALLFTLLTWGVLMLWAGLFKAIDIQFFYDLFTERWFYYPALSLAHGFGIIIFRHQANVIDTITRLQQALMKYVLVLLVFVSITFLIALPFTGLAPLWESGGSLLILWMQALMLFFLNAVYQDEPHERPYALPLHRFIYIGLALLPLYSIISLYGLSLRVDQYGWTVMRCWAVLAWAVLALFSAGYVWGIVRHKDAWLQQVSWVNVRMGLVVLALMLLANSPVLDFRHIAVSSQLQRLERGAVSLDEFDYAYFHNQLAKPGYHALQALKAQYQTTHPEIALRITGLYADEDETAVTEADFIRAINGVTESTPTSLLTALFDELRESPWRLARNQAYHLLAVDMNNDQVRDYILVEERAHGAQLTLYYEVEGNWSTKLLSANSESPDCWREHPSQLVDAVRADDYEAVEAAWQEFRIGKRRYQVR